MSDSDRSSSSSLSGDPKLNAYLEQLVAEHTWTGASYDETRSLDELASFLEGQLKQAVMTGALPGPRTDYRVTAWTVPRRSLTHNHRTLVIWSHRIAIEKGFRESLLELGQRLMRPFNKSVAVQEDDGAYPSPRLAFRVEAFMPTVMSSQESRALQEKGWTREQIERERVGRYFAALKES